MIHFHLSLHPVLFLLSRRYSPLSPHIEDASVSFAFPINSVIENHIHSCVFHFVHQVFILFSQIVWDSLEIQIGKWISFDGPSNNGLLRFLENYPRPSMRNGSFSDESLLISWKIWLKWFPSSSVLIRPDLSTVGLFMNIRSSSRSLIRVSFQSASGNQIGKVTVAMLRCTWSMSASTCQLSPLCSGCFSCSLNWIHWIVCE